jgi:hypothetical protein
VKVPVHWVYDAGLGKRRVITGILWVRDRMPNITPHVTFNSVRLSLYLSSLARLCRTETLNLTKLSSYQCIQMSGDPTRVCMQLYPQSIWLMVTLAKRVDDSRRRLTCDRHRLAVTGKTMSSRQAREQADGLIQAIVEHSAWRLLFTKRAALVRVLVRD